MIVCICKRARQADIAGAIEDGASTLQDVADSCGGAGTGCGRCREYIHDMLEDAGVGCDSTGASCPDCPGRVLSLAG